MAANARAMDPVSVFNKAEQLLEQRRDKEAFGALFRAARCRPAWPHLRTIAWARSSTGSSGSMSPYDCHRTAFRAGHLPRARHHRHRSPLLRLQIRFRRADPRNPLPDVRRRKGESIPATTRSPSRISRRASTLSACGCIAMPAIISLRRTTRPISAAVLRAMPTART